MSYDTYKKNRYYELRHEYKTIKKEYEDLHSVITQISKQFIIEVQQICIKLNLSDPFANDESDLQVGGTNCSSFSLETKSLYRQLAKLTHPDKKGDNLSENKKKEIYNAANQAKRENNLQELLSLSKEASCLPKSLDINTQTLNLLESNLNEINEKLNKLKQSYVWLWFCSDNIQKKKLVLDFIDSSQNKI